MKLFLIEMSQIDRFGNKNGSSDMHTAVRKGKSIVPAMHTVTHTTHTTVRVELSWWQKQRN